MGVKQAMLRYRNYTAGVAGNKNIGFYGKHLVGSVPLHRKTEFWF
jgi:hypothetical protein